MRPIRKYSEDLGLVMCEASANVHVFKIFSPNVFIPVDDREANIEMFAEKNGEN